MHEARASRSQKCQGIRWDQFPPPWERLSLHQKGTRPCRVVKGKVCVRTVTSKRQCRGPCKTLECQREEPVNGCQDLESAIGIRPPVLGLGLSLQLLMAHPGLLLV